jgi:hypothetical protein
MSIKYKRKREYTIPESKLRTMIRFMIKDELNKTTNFTYAKVHMMPKQQLKIASPLSKNFKSFTSDFIKSIISNI